jgi:lipoprotein NlpI
MTTGCASTNTSRDPLMSGLLLAEPQEISTRSQIAVAHYTNNLFQLRLSNDERAELLYQRGIQYDSMGLSSLARMDFAEAIKLKPTLAEAHNSIGVHYIQAGMFVLAYEAFDATLEINPEYDFAILNRGIALYYGGRSQLAAKDTQAYLAKDPSDPIRLLWHYIALSGVSEQVQSSSDLQTNVENNANKEQANKEQANQILMQSRAALQEEQWATSIVDYYLGKGSETQVIASLLKDVRSPTELNYRLCEAYFYLGKFHAAKGNFTKAQNYFKLSLSTNVYEYVEHKYSRIELSKLRQSLREARNL